MALSNTATPIYYGQFREAVLRGDIPVCREISMEMNRIDDLIANPGIWYDDKAVEGFVNYCENELTLTNGEDLHLLDSFKLWAEQIFGWHYFVERSIYVPNPDGHGGHYVNKRIRKRLIKKQYLIVARGAAKSMYASCLQNYFLNVDTSTTHQVTTAPTMAQAEEVMSPIRTAITRKRGPLFQFLTEGSLQNTTGSAANRVKLASTKKGIQNFLTGSLLEVRPMSVDIGKLCGGNAERACQKHRGAQRTGKLCGKFQFISLSVVHSVHPFCCVKTLQIVNITYIIHYILILHKSFLKFY